MGLADIIKCGKSYLACVIACQACMWGYKVLYFGIQRLIEKIAQVKPDGTFVELLNRKKYENNP
ncbi:MAG: ATP-binding protein [Bacteroidetes bacterium]|nr:ATP-binding protein [Bacteroidota bacterium]